MSLLGLYRRFIIALDWTLTHMYIRRFEVVGRENIPLEGPLILVSNHVNNADPPMVALAARPRYPTYMAKLEMIRWPVIGPAFRIFGAFPVRRGQADRSAIRAATEVVESGAMLVMFPEGSRSRTGVLTKGHPGTASIALRTGAPLLPVAITGTERISWPWIFLKPLSVPHVKVMIGEPFRLPAVERINSEATAKATIEIMGHIAALLPERCRGVYADAADGDAAQRTPAEARPV